MEVSGQLHAPAFLFRLNISLFPFDRRLSGAQRPSGRGSKKGSDEGKCSEAVLLVK
jgi:hypothetical protein